MRIAKAMARHRQLVTTILISLVGVEAFRLFQLPLPWLLGPMTACLVAALAGMPMRGAPLWSRNGPSIPENSAP